MGFLCSGSICAVISTHHEDFASQCHQFLAALSLKAQQHSVNMKTCRLFAHLNAVRLQDLRRARMVLWVDDAVTVYTNETAVFFDEFVEHITIKRFDYQQVRAFTSSNNTLAALACI